MKSHSAVRVVFILLVVVLAVTFTLAAADVFTVDDQNTEYAQIQTQISDGIGDTQDISTASEDVTVVSTQGIPIVGSTGEIVAFDSQGQLYYYESAHQMYFDITVVEQEQHTINYVAADKLSGADCATVETDNCTKSVYRHLNLSTGTSTEIYSEITPAVQFTRWHDVTPYNETHIAVASIANDGVFLVNTETEAKTWVWNASEAFEQPTKDPVDWTHLNDVSVTDDGAIYLSLRNQDQVAFIEPTNGSFELNQSRTLGTDDTHDILYEQHNPDYMSPATGDETMLVGDSENNRVVEYTYRDNNWEQEHVWRDSRLQWPRDADRLDDGGTLITDSNGERVFKIDDSGSVVWGAEIGLPYEAEQLQVDESSSSGPTPSIDERDTRGVSSALLTVKDTLPRSLVNGVLFVTPHWITFTELLLGLSLTVVVSLWTGIERLVYSKGND